MKKFAAGMAVLAAAGFTGLSMAPASAQMFQNCTQANNAGLYNIPATSPAYSPDLDRGGDGIACEGDIDFNPTLVPGYVAPVTPPVVSEPVTTAVFDNCTEARAAGAVNIPATDPRYGLHLDRDRDGFGCDADGSDDGVQTDIIVDYVPESWNTGAGADQYSQMNQVPTGAADTGVVVENDSTAGGLVLGGGTALAAAAGAALVLHRRSAVRS
ncbi:excalibur calcium-binding domain-containing protein [Kocuria sp. M1N1S27]|uniref:excalibur calcium-binding domain-containing protein n=1 Tax=Kocuria kalidii TaxID=3376283 RepID=UPI00379EABB3